MDIIRRYVVSNKKLGVPTCGVRRVDTSQILTILQILAILQILDTVFGLFNMRRMVELSPKVFEVCNARECLGSFRVHCLLLLQKVKKQN